MKKAFALLIALLVLLPGVAMAQAKAPAKAEAKLVFFDDDTQLMITDDKGNQVIPNEGMVILPKWKVVTQKTTAEIQLTPNSSILKLAANTTFQIDSLKEPGGTGSNDFAVQAGKIRAVAAKMVGSNNTPGYNVRTPTSNCGVRGTDFAIKYDPASKQDYVLVQEGKVDFTNTTTGETVGVGSGQTANTYDTVFAPVAASPEQLADTYSDVGFKKLDPAAVKEDGSAPAAEAAPIVAPAPVPSPDADKDKKAAEAAAPSADDPMMEMLKKLLNMEIGSVTISGTTYSKAILSPVIAFDGFKLGLYLPIIYTSDMFDPNDWYHPAGNDEWSFGMQEFTKKKPDYLVGALDLLSDVALKIKFLEMGRPGFDNFYLKVGNLKTMSLGHGSIMYNFANDQDFPAIRKIGLNTGIKFAPVGLEFVTDDLADPQLLGGRLAFDVIGDMVSIGVSGVADTKLANNYYDKTNKQAKTAESLGNPVLIVGGIDTQLLKLDLGPVFRTLVFADANTITANYPTSYKDATGKTLISAGLKDSTISKSYGLEAGMFGNILIVDYRLSFQYEKGLYKNALYRSNYYRTRSDQVDALTTYLSNADSAAATDKITNMGVFGSFGFDLAGFLTMEGAYRWPMKLEGGKIVSSEDDSLKVALTIPKDKIPFVKLSGGVSYERTKFVPTLISGGADLFDANTVMKGEVIYGMSKGLDLVIGVGTIVLRDAAGQIVYNSNGKQKVGPSINLETRLSF